MIQKAIAGIDIGGTKIAVALENSAGDRIASRRLPTRTAIGPDGILANVLDAIDGMLVETGSELAAVGIGCPGPIDIERGLVLSPANLPDWIDFPIVKRVGDRFGVPVLLDNDANAAALGEFHFGAGRGFRDVFYVTVSTGIGGSIIIDGELRHGLQAGAGEIGHTIISIGGDQCRCGLRGCLEALASGTAIARRMREALVVRDGGTVDDFADVTAQTVVDLVRTGDPTATAGWQEAIRFLAVGIGNAITLIAPQAVVVGGGVAAAGELLLGPLRELIRGNVTMLPIDRVEILQASLGSESGVCGALILGRRAFERSAAAAGAP